MEIEQQLMARVRELRALGHALSSEVRGAFARRIRERRRVVAQ